ncbi:MAG: VOC family protein [Bacteroidetes bacterium]|nr:VOC family protein [Bacteroidota bacterium]
MIQGIHHIAIICTNYEVSRRFYTEILGFEIIAEHFREERNSWKLDLALNGNYLLELFSFPNVPERISHPEAAGLRHLAFAVQNLELEVERLKHLKVFTEEIRHDALTGKPFTFFKDPDGLPIELYEM